MADNNKENKMSIDDFDFAHEEANDYTPMLVNYLVTKLQQAMGNLALQGEVQQQLHGYGILPPFQQERGPERFHGETSKRGLSTEKGVENPYQDLKQLREGKPSSKKKAHVQHEESPSKEREESESQDESMEDVAPRRRRAQRFPTPTKLKRSPHNPHRRESKREEKNSKKKERKRLPSSPSLSPSSSSDKSSGSSSQEKQRRGHRRSYATWKRSNKLKKFKEGGKNISFLTYDGTFSSTDKAPMFLTMQLSLLEGFPEVPYFLSSRDITEGRASASQIGHFSHSVIGFQFWTGLSNDPDISSRNVRAFRQCTIALTTGSMASASRLPASN
ncbi:hypothetical protein L7F22_027708 [Adiantum nelumboides]|nr:hypothetical protein [Adiantum nelumboides]